MCHQQKLELAWAAGFFDGEGTTHSTVASLQLSVGQVDRRNLERFKSAVGVGNISTGVRISTFRAYGRFANSALASLWPYLGEAKKDQAVASLLKHSMRQVAQWRGGEYCARGHRFAETGYTSSRECRQCRKDRVRGVLAPIVKRRAIELGIGMRTYKPAVET